jgi:hypothetical protein
VYDSVFPSILIPEFRRALLPALTQAAQIRNFAHALVDADARIEKLVRVTMNLRDRVEFLEQQNRDLVLELKDVKCEIKAREVTPGSSLHRRSFPAA